MMRGLRLVLAVSGLIVPMFFVGGCAKSSPPAEYTRNTAEHPTATPGAGAVSGNARPRHKKSSGDD